MEIEQFLQPLFEPELFDQILKVGRLQEVKEGQIVISPGQPIVFMPIVLEGTLKVSMVEENGKELLMYYLSSTDSCAMTFTCCMQQQKSHILAQAEEDSKLWLIPVEHMEEWMKQYSSWRNFVMSTMQSRFYEVLRALDMVAFNSLDIRLLNYLKERSKTTGKTVLTISHEKIANDLASSRVVISRMLKKLENQGRVLLYRNQIKLLSTL